MKFFLIFFIFFPILVQAQVVSLKEYLAKPLTPLQLTVQLGSQVQTQKISALQGGTISLTLKNGDTVELYLPPKALPTDEEVTLQEVDKISNSMFPNGLGYSSV